MRHHCPTYLLLFSETIQHHPALGEILSIRYLDDKSNWALIFVSVTLCTHAHIPVIHPPDLVNWDDPLVFFSSR